jgi:hypothetical protein
MKLKNIALCAIAVCVLLGATSASAGWKTYNHHVETYCYKHPGKNNGHRFTVRYRLYLHSRKAVIENWKKEVWKGNRYVGTIGRNYHKTFTNQVGARQICRRMFGYNYGTGRYID